MRRTLAFTLLCFVLLGCELVADFDRSRIPASDAGTKKTPSKNEPEDAGRPSPIDSSVTNNVDASSDASSDAGSDADGG